LWGEGLGVEFERKGRHGYFIDDPGIGAWQAKLAALRAQEKALGMSAEGYARQLIEDGIALDRQAGETTFDELFAPVQRRFKKSGMSEAELDKLVDAARTRHHKRASRRAS
jgi:hypothetical protein